jgi:hypothetical protein
MPAFQRISSTKIPNTGRRAFILGVSMAVKKSVRFEVFKRDKFTCQYCGRSAPDVILHVDHIHPVSKGGGDDITNLITACIDCNLGKKARELGDDAAIKKMQNQLEELQEKRNQLEMMLQWKLELDKIGDAEIDAAAEYWDSLSPTWTINDHGKALIAKTIRKYGLEEVMECMKISVYQYTGREKLPNSNADDHYQAKKNEFYKAFDYIERIARSRRLQEKKPYLGDLYYIRAIIRNRMGYLNEYQALDILEKAYLSGVEVDTMKGIAMDTGVRNWTAWKSRMLEVIEEYKGDGELPTDTR